MAIAKRHADLKEEFYAQVHAQTHQTPEAEQRQRMEVVRLKEALAAAALPVQPPERAASEVDTDVLAFCRHPR
ncbi:hypothetical protein [Streptomyces sp. NPDC093970]|uniref:hypothetical protein n=1 Tax=Streptomyces sp. NPDC093970 TaxID=3155076 RepID=UPI00342A40A3